MKNFLSLIDLFISKYPFTILSIPFVILNWHALTLLLIGLLIDLFLPGLFALYQSYNSYRMLKKEMRKDGFFTGEYRELDSELVNQFNELMKSTSETNPRQLGIGTRFITKFNKNVRVILSDKIRTKFTTILDTWEDSFIIVKRWFDEADIKDVTKLAHEFGHVFHAFKRSEFYHKAFMALVLLVILLCCAVTKGLWWPFVISLPLCFIVFIRYSVWVESYCESMADIYALYTYESLWGYDAMVQAAIERLKDRIYTCRQTKYGNDFKMRRHDRFTMYVPINYLARFIPVEVCENLIEKSNDKSSECNENQGLSPRERQSILSIENLIRQALERNKNIQYDSSKYFIFFDTNLILSFCYLLSFLMTAIAVFKTFSDYHFNWASIPIWTVLIIAIIAYIIYQLIFMLLWNKKTKLKQRIGL